MFSQLSFSGGFPLFSGTLLLSYTPGLFDLYIYGLFLSVCLRMYLCIYVCLSYHLYILVWLSKAVCQVPSSVTFYLIFSKIYFYFMFINVLPVYVSVLHMCAVPVEARRESTGSHGSGVIQGC